MAELAVDGVTVRFGGLTALDDVSVTVPGGKVIGLIGPNGAGKTTLFDVITGLRRPERGRVHLDDEDITGALPHARSRRGLSRTFQRLELFGSLTAGENVQLAAEARLGGAEATSVASRLLERLGLATSADVAADMLPTGLARLVELGRALATSPSILLLDEPSAGLDEDETAVLGRIIGELAAEGLGVLLVEHDMSLVMSRCDEVVVLDAGAVICRGTPEAVRADERVQAAYLGTPQDSAAPSVVRVGPAPSLPDKGRQPMLELRHVRAGYGRIEVVHGVSLSVVPGTVTALLGPNGAGKSTLLKVASGRLRPGAGSVWLEGHEVTTASTESLARRGLCAVPEGRAVFPNLTVAENLRMFATLSSNPKEVAARAYQRFPALADRRRQLAGRLSGGEQQMLALCRALSVEPKVLLVDELSMGLAPLVVEELYGVLGALVVEEGLSVLLVEQFARAALALADTAAVMVNGILTQTGPSGDVEDKLVASYLGASD